MALFLSCVKIFFCRILDVSLGTVRQVITVKGKSVPAALIGFLEVFVWYVIVKDAINADGNVWAIAVAYAGGFSAGTYIGSMLSKKLVKGDVLIQVITSSRDQAILDGVRDAGYAISVVRIEANDYGPAKWMFWCNINRDLIKEFEKTVTKLDDKAFVVVSDSVSRVGGFVAKKK